MITKILAKIAQNGACCNIDMVTKTFPVKLDLIQDIAALISSTLLYMRGLLSVTLFANPLLSNVTLPQVQLWIHSSLKND